VFIKEKNYKTRSVRITIFLEQQDYDTLQELADEMGLTAKGSRAIQLILKKIAEEYRNEPSN